MATQEKLLKSLEILKKLTTSNQGQGLEMIQRKDKIQHCHVVTDAISNPSIQVATNFHVLLSFTMEVLFKLCDDKDIRMIAEECLNRIIRAINDVNIGKIQIELHKEIKRNGSPTSLRAALHRFSQLAHLIRPHKGKPYVVNVFPSLVRIAERKEEQVQETIASSLPNIIKVLGPFTSDNDIKNILKAFLNNICNSAASIRRTSSNCIQNICLNCRRPSYFFNYCVQYAIDLMLPINEINDSYLILGAMNVLKTLLPHLNNAKNFETSENFGNKLEQSLGINGYLQIYELCLHLLSHKDHNIINSALETLHVILQNCPKDLEMALLSPNGISKSRIYVMDSLKKFKSPSQLSVATNVTLGEESMGSELELTDSFRKDIEKWIDESKLSVSNITYARTRENVEKSQSLDNSSNTVNIPHSESDVNIASNYNMIGKVSDLYLKTQSIEDNLDAHSLSENSTEKSYSCTGEDVSEANFKEIDIGDFADKMPSLLYTARLVSKTFLLTGMPNGCIKDKVSRVSVKASALTCLSSICNIYPNVLLQCIDKRSEYGNGHIGQQISDVILFADHSDPQLRGNVRLLIANFLRTGITCSGGHYQEWLKENATANDVSNLNLNRLISLLAEGLEDESSQCCIHTLLILKICLKCLLEIEESYKVIPILNALPALSKKPYWLVKVSLCDLVSNLPYITIHHVTKTKDFQNKVVYSILFDLLGDVDQRVQTASANAIKSIIPFLYYEDFQAETTVTMKAIHYQHLYLSNLSEKQNNTSWDDRRLIKIMPFPFNRFGEVVCSKLEFTLSRIIYKLFIRLLETDSKHFVAGCIESMALLSRNYPCTMYINAWNCSKNLMDNGTDSKIQVSDLLNSCTNFMNNSVHSYDISFHVNVLVLASNLYAGYSMSLIGTIPEDEGNSNSMWNMFTNSKHSLLSETLMKHIMKLICIFHHILDDITPVSLHPKTVLSNLPNASNLSPIKRRKSDLDKKFISPVKSVEDKSDKRDNFKTNFVGTFFHSPHYIKLYEILKASYTNYKTSLDTEASGKFLGLLRATLRSLLILMEIGTLNEFGRIAEEILGYLNTTFRLEPTLSVKCVQQLLRSLFGTNLSANVLEIIGDYVKKEEKNTSAKYSGFYYNISQKPYNDLSECINSFKNFNRVECDGDDTVMGYLHRRSIKKTTTMSKALDKVLANYIRIFEPMVIKSLKQYTITTDVKLQCCVLQLLSQLVQLRINYCLLDSDQIFIGFVLKQFEFIEKGQIPLPQELIPNIFQFLVQLSYSKQHSKSIISIPKIIQLCDGLMACEQSSLTHCIPALKPFVEDIFLTRNKLNTADMNELETTREVVLSMLLKLSEYPQVVDLIVLILDDSKYCSDTEKWFRWSLQVFSTLLSMLKLNKFKLDNIEAFISLRKLIFVLNPGVYKPIDEIVILLFQEPPNIVDDVIMFNRWLGKILILFLVLSTVEEDVLISHITTLKNHFHPGSVFENVVIAVDPLNVSFSADYFQNYSPELILLNFIFRTIKLASEKCSEIAKTVADDFFVEELSMFLILCLHNFQSGSHCRITNVAISSLSKKCERSSSLEIDSTNANFKQLILFYPTLTFQWCYLLTLLNYIGRSFWSSILQIAEEPSKDLETFSTAINFEIVRVGGTIVYCDYLSENSLSDGDIPWILNNNINSLINLFNEAPVYEFLSFIHRDVNNSKTLLDSISKNCFHINNALFKSKLLKCIENAHPSQTGNLIKLILPKILNVRELALSRTVAKLAGRKIELLLTMPMEEVHNQLKKEDLVTMMTSFVNMNIASKQETLLGLLNKLASQYYDLSPFQISQRRCVNPEYIKKVQINKNWYLSQVKSKFDNAKIGKEAAEILNKLDQNELDSLMASNDFNKLILKDCLEYGVKLYKSGYSKVEPNILKSSMKCLMDCIKDIIDSLPDTYKVTVSSDSEESFSTSIPSIPKELVDKLTVLYDIIPSTSYFVQSLPSIPSYKIPEEDCDYLIKFGMICLNLINYLTETDKYNVHIVEAALTCADSIFKKSSLYDNLSSDYYVLWLCSAVDCIFDFISYLLLNDEPLPPVPKYILKTTIDKLETKFAGQACYRLYILVCWLHKIRNSIVNISKFLLEPIKSIIISLSRLPIFNSYILVPIKVFTTGWDPLLSGSFNTQVPPLPIEFLQEVDIFEEYIFRVTLLGWTTRQQFEETWMCLLSVLCNTPSETSSTEEIDEMAHASTLAVKAITTLLMQTLHYPIPGKTNVSNLIHVSRDSSIPCDSISIRKLRKLHLEVQNNYNDPQNWHQRKKMNSVFDKPNLEKQNNMYSYGQVSIKHLLIASRIIEDVEEKCSASLVWKVREQMLEASGLDVTSCLQFLLDFYTQLLQTQCFTPLRLLHEIVRSVVIISDLFTDKSQFSWMLNLFLELLKTHAVEDELLHKYLIVGACKAVAILTPELEIYEVLKKYLVQYLKSPYLPSRIACLYGLLYIIEGCKLSNITIGGISEELQLILPCAVEYIQCNLTVSNSVIDAQDHTLLTWALAFFIMENIDEIHIETNFVYNTLTTAYSILCQKTVATAIHISIMKGLERLIVLKKNMSEKTGKQIVKLALGKMKSGNPTMAIFGIQLLFSYMFTEYAEHVENNDKSEIVQTNPENMVLTMEKMSALFEYIKKGYIFEVEVLCSVLPNILNDFFSPSDILTKVIGEFMSSQQPHPKLMSKVVFHLFQRAIQQKQLPLLQDWVVFSLPNFTQNFSIGMATWCLTCFFISASCNEWLRSFFPYIQTRIQRYEYEDKKMLCIAGSDFYRNLATEKQKQTFRENFKNVKDQPDTPFKDLLLSL